MRNLRPVGLPLLAVSAGSTTPNPGYPSVAWSTVSSSMILWNGSTWVDFPTASNATTSAAGLMSSTDKVKLDGLPSSIPTILTRGQIYAGSLNNNGIF